MCVYVDICLGGSTFGYPKKKNVYTVPVKPTGFRLGDACNRSERMDTLASKGVACGL